MVQDTASLGNQAILAKVDKLRELNIGSSIPLPQLVVVGDQSSGKSSVLESLTGFSFPRAAGLCTRYATQITCCRDAQDCVEISIIPRPDANDELKAKLLAFQRHIEGELTNKELVTIFEEANAVMGIRMHISGSEDTSSGAFSQDTLRIEIKGPEQTHLTVIDVPGIFRVPTPGLTTENDIVLVENMVKSYMADKRTIILAVIPCNVDIATQEILKLAEIADNDGARTMAVLTKPDLATEVATQNAIMDLVLGKKSHLKLGYWVVKNRSADDSSSTLEDRAESEYAFFRGAPWSNALDHCGIPVLKDRLQRLLLKITKQELPKVKIEIKQRLDSCREKLNDMGQSRSDHISQRQYLGKIASEFQTITHQALNGQYSGQKLFKTHPDLKLVTRIYKLQTEFVETFRSSAHTDHFNHAPSEAAGTDEEDSSTEESEQSLERHESSFEERVSQYQELQGIVLDGDYECPKPNDALPILDKVRSVYNSSRGPDLGTFGGVILSTVFEDQTEKWEPLTHSHISKIILVVHEFIDRMLHHLCREEQVRSQLWNNLLIPKLRDCYHRAIENARFLLSIERKLRPNTSNHYFNDTLQKKRTKRLVAKLEESASSVYRNEKSEMVRLKEKHVPLSAIAGLSTNESNEEHVCEEIYDVFESYYKVAGKRFTDVIFQQSILHFLMEGDVSPLKIFGTDLIMTLNEEQLELLAGEDEETKELRTSLKRQQVRFEEALKCL